jgi:hypothetical protein
MRKMQELTSFSLHDMNDSDDSGFGDLDEEDNSGEEYSYDGEDKGEESDGDEFMGSMDLGMNLGKKCFSSLSS